MIDLRQLNPKDRKRLAKEMALESAGFPQELAPIPVEPARPGSKSTPVSAFRSRGYLVVFYREANGWLRMSVNRAAINPQTGDWLDGISWETLQRLKREAGYGAYDAVEVYPRDEDVVNVANIRHLFILPDRKLSDFDCIWRAGDVK